MTRAEIREVLFTTLHRIAPEIDPAMLRGDVPLRDQVDLDSMDLLNLMIGLSEQLGIEIPEADYGRLVTIDQTVAYLQDRLPASRP